MKFSFSFVLRDVLQSLRQEGYELTLGYVLQCPWKGVGSEIYYNAFEGKMQEVHVCEC